MSDFQQTVDLRKKLESKRKPSAPLEEIYQGQEVEPKEDLGKISRPTAKKDYSQQIRAAVFLIAVLVVGFMAWKLFFGKNETIKVDKNSSWYAVKLVDGEIFYGQITDIKTDPVAINNVYYNYDQAKAKEGGKAIEETGTLRLVKRGKETHGPDGSLQLVRAQVLFMEPLKVDSAVLKAILEYEK